MGKPYIKTTFRLIVFVGALFISGVLNAQNSVSIGTDQINSNAVLWLQGNGSQGFILPVVTGTGSISGPEAGMVVYDQSSNTVQYFNGTAWVGVGSGSGGGSTYGLTYTNGVLTLVDGGTANQITVSLLGDVSGDANATTVTAIQGRNISNTAPADTQVLAWNNANSQWEPTTIGTVTGDNWGTQVVQTDGTLTGDGTSGSPLSVANVNDADANPTNEIQTISKSGTTVTLSNGGGSFTDAVNDADADPTNEIQTIDQLSLNGTNLEISLLNDGQPVQTVDLSSLGGGTGDMLQSTYDITGTIGVVDAAESLTGSITSSQISDAGTIVTQDGTVSSDGTLGGGSASNGNIPTELAVKTYVDAAVSGSTLPTTTDGQVLISDAGGTLQARSISGDVNLVNTGAASIQSSAGNNIVTAINNAATTSTIGTNKLNTAVVLDSESPNAAGDISGNFASGLTIDAGAVTTTEIAAGTNNQVLVTDGTGTVSWIDQTSLPAGTVSGGVGGSITDNTITADDLADGAVSGGTGGELTDNSITGADISTTADVTVNSVTASTFTGDGSALTNVNASQIDGVTVSAASPTTNYILRYNGTNWIADAGGAQWYQNTTAPGAATGINGDFYLNTTNGDVYEKQSGSWVLVGNIAGTDGLSGDIYSTTSSTAYNVGTGPASPSFTLDDTGLAYTVGQTVIFGSRSTPANTVTGTVTAYSEPTITINVTAVTGSGSSSDWDVNLNGAPGAAGEDAYIYVGYADDASGTNFSTSPGTREFIGFVTSNTTLTPVAGDFSTFSRFRDLSLTDEVNMTVTNRVARYDGSQLIDGIITDNGTSVTISGGLSPNSITMTNQVNEFSTDATLGGNSNTAVPTEAAVKTYIDNAVSGVGVPSTTSGQILVNNGSSLVGTTVTGDVTISSTGVTNIAADAVGTNEIANGSIANGDLNKSAIPISGFSAATVPVNFGGQILNNVGSPSVDGDAANKLYVDNAVAGLGVPSTTSGQILVNNGSSLVGTTVTGDVTISNTGVTNIATGAVGTNEIANGSIANGDLNKSAIPISGFSAATVPVNFGGQILNNVGNPSVDGDAANKLYVDNAISGLATLPSMNDAQIIVSSTTTPTAVSMTGDVTISNTGVTNISNSAVGTAEIADGTIANGDLNKSAIPWSGFSAATTTLDAGGQIINNVGAPSVDGDAANKLYVDNAVAGVSLPATTDAQILVSNGTSLGGVDLTGDIAIDNLGATSIQTTAGDNVIGAINDGGTTTTVNIDRITSPGGTDKGFLTTDGTTNSWLTTANANKVFGTDQANALTARSVILSTGAAIDNSGVRASGTASDANLVSEAAVREAIDAAGGITDLQGAYAGGSSILLDGTNEINVTSSAGTILFATDDTNQRVGFGIASPTYFAEFVGPDFGFTNNVMRLTSLNANTFVDLEGAATGSGGFRIRSNGGANSLIFQTGGNNDRMFIDASGDVGIGTGTLLSGAGYQMTSTIARKQSIFSTTTGASVLELQGNNIGIGNEVGMIDFVNYSGTFNQYNFARIAATSQHATNKTYGALRFYTNQLGTLSEQMIIDNLGNVGIGTSTPLVALDVEDTDAIKIPVGTTGQRPATPTAGMIRYNTTDSQYEAHNGSGWSALGGSSSGWSLTGNSGTTAGTNFIGTTDNVALIFKQNNVQAGYLNANTASTFFGSNAGLVNVGNLNTGFGHNALTANTSGTDNVAVGVNALATNTTGTSNTAIGAYANVGSGALTNATAIGAGASVTQSNSLVLGSNANVGVGTSAPLGKFQVENTLTMFYEENQGQDYITHNAYEFASGDVRYINTDGASAIAMQPERIGFFTFPSGTANTGISGFSTRMNLTSDGLVLNGDNLDASSALDINSTTKGVLLPRMTTTQRDAIGSPATGLMVYNTTTNGFNYYDGSSWTDVGGSSPWTISGSDIYRSTGNVGIGTNLPENTVHIIDETNGPILKLEGPLNGVGLDPVLRFSEVFSGDYGFDLYLDSDQNRMKFRSISNSATLVDDIITMDRTSGDVGVGVAAPSAKLDVDGNVETTGEYTYSAAKTRYYSSGPGEFQSNATQSYDMGKFLWTATTRYTVFINGTGGSIGYASAGVHLPHGAVVTGVDAYLWRNDGTSSIDPTIKLVRHQMGANTDGTLATCTATADMASVQTISAASITNATIDNSTYDYTLVFSADQSNGNMRLYGVRITYTVTQAD